MGFYLAEFAEIYIIFKGKENDTKFQLARLAQPGS